MFGVSAADRRDALSAVQEEKQEGMATGNAGGSLAREGPSA